MRQDWGNRSLNIATSDRMFTLHLIYKLLFSLKKIKDNVSHALEIAILLCIMKRFFIFEDEI